MATALLKELGISHSIFGAALGRQGLVADAFAQRRMAAEIDQSLTTAATNDSKVLISQVWNWKELWDLQRKAGTPAAANNNYALARTVAEKRGRRSRFRCRSGRHSTRRAERYRDGGEPPMKSNASYTNFARFRMFE
jgi:hypothetical protein